jgi:CelD/BcsL family acetyltransferase involved in cellulose biosynthesis
LDRQVIMSQVTQAAFDARIGLDDESLADARHPSVARSDIRLALHEDLAAVEQDWRAFEQTADGTVFQSFDWLSIWQQHIGVRKGVVPVIVTGRDGDGRLLFLLPLGLEDGGLARRLTWLGTELCDYNGPLLAPDFATRVDAARFAQLWQDITARLQSHPRLRFDLVDLDKMQDVVGSQRNPFIGLGVAPHANGAYLTHLNGDWEAFYKDKRSSATRRRDRTKRKKLGEFGEVRFVTPAAGDVAATLETLMQQKSKAFAAMGVVDMFALPGHREFYQALAARREFVHVSRLDVGAQTAAANLGMVFRGSYYHLLASYDGGELSKYGPGAAHMHDLLRYAIEQGCGAFDFTIGDERYKQEWCDRQITLFDHVSAATLRGVPAALRSYAVGRTKRWIKQTPAVWDAVYKMRAFIGPLMRRLRG